METKLRGFVEVLDFAELHQLKQDLDKGAVQFRKILNDKILEKQRQHGLFCATCQADIEPSNDNALTIVFGPADLRQKASFCAIDCMQYFMKNIKARK